MKKWILFIPLCLLFILVGCNKNDPTIDNHPKEQLDGSRVNYRPPLEKNDSGNKSTGMTYDETVQRQLNELPFTQFDLKVTYGVGEYYELHFKNIDPKGQFFALIQDNLSGGLLKGGDAFMAIYNLFKDIQLDGDEASEDFAHHILSTLRIDSDYQTISLEMTLENGEMISIKQ